MKDVTLLVAYINYKSKLRIATVSTDGYTGEHVAIFIYLNGRKQI